MSGDINRYIVTIKYQVSGLRPVNELNNDMTRAGFSLTITDKAGKVHETGPGSWGITTPLSGEDVAELARRLSKLALGEEPDMDIVTLEEWLQTREHPE
ncbi:type V toxin-antitoxin system endoribonuclease antitoxin GhoS [Erwinia sp. CPCC 100877]|nr:type V toxin-antitoxin system endoribonuclease antitoxin GhoS [Erwinia sp. CPCC 100877]